MKLTFKKTDKMFVCNKLLSNLHYSDRVNFYLLAGYKEFNIDMKKWKDLYPESLTEHFFIKLNKEYKYNNTFICDVFEEFQICTLLISEINDLDQEYDFSYLRLHLKDMSILLDGYRIDELTDEHIVIKGNIQDLYQKNIIDDELKPYNGNILEL